MEIGEHGADGREILLKESFCFIPRWESKGIDLSCTSLLGGSGLASRGLGEKLVQ